MQSMDSPQHQQVDGYAPPENLLEIEVRLLLLLLLLPPRPLDLLSPLPAPN